MGKAIQIGIAIIVGLVVGMMGTRVYYVAEVEQHLANNAQLNDALVAKVAELEANKSELAKANARYRVLSKRVPTSSRLPAPGPSSRETPEP